MCTITGSRETLARSIRRPGRIGHRTPMRAAHMRQSEAGGIASDHLITQRDHILGSARGAFTLAASARPNGRLPLRCRRGGVFNPVLG